MVHLSENMITNTPCHFTLLFSVLFCLVGCDQSSSKKSTQSSAQSQFVSADPASQATEQKERSHSANKNAEEGKPLTAEQQAIKVLSWVQTADVDADYEKAVLAQDFRLWVLASRSPTMPGTDIQQYSQLEKMCGQKYLPGVGDVLYGKTHGEWHQAATDYAAAYNRKMAVYCEKQLQGDKR